MNRTESQTIKEIIAIGRKIFGRPVKVSFIPLFGNPELQKENGHYQIALVDSKSGSRLLVQGYVKGKAEAAEILLARLKTYPINN